MMEEAWNGRKNKSMITINRENLQEIISEQYEIEQINILPQKVIVPEKLVLYQEEYIEDIKTNKNVENIPYLLGIIVRDLINKNKLLNDKLYEVIE